MACSAKEKRYRGKRTKKVAIMEPEFDENGDQTKASMMYGRIDPAYLTRLIMEHKKVMMPYVEEKKALIAAGKKEEAAKLRPPQMGDKLGVVVDIIIKKTMGLPRWREYTPAWHEDMYAHALELILRYCHNFDPVKLQGADPYFYIGQIAWNAFNQVWGTLDKQNKRIKFIPLVDGIYHAVTAMDQYAGVLEKAEKEKAEKQKAELANEHISDIDETVDIMKELDESIGIHIEDEWVEELHRKMDKQPKDKAE